MEMTQEEADFYLDILTEFRSIPQILLTVEVSRPTLQRWLDKDTIPAERYRKPLQKALDRLTTDLIKKGGVKAEIGMFIEGLTEPTPKTRDLRQSSKRRTIQAFLAEMLGDGKDHQSTDIINALKAKGYTRSNIQSASQKMGVIKNHVGLGRNSYSLWRLP